MPQITVWKCSHTGHLFETKDEYIKHLKEVALHNLSSKKHDKTINACNAMVQSAKNLTDLEIAISKAIKYYYKSCGVSVGSIKVTLSNMRFYCTCSNTHHCPKGGVINWNWDKDKPQGYSGLRGRIRIEYSQTTDRNIDKARYKANSQVLDFSPLVENFCIHTGCGGGGDTSVGYDVTLFMDDFPNLSEMYNDIIEDILT